MIWTFVWSNVIVAWAPLVGTNAFWTTWTVKEVPTAATGVLGGVIRSVLPAADTVATAPSAASRSASMTASAPNSASLERRLVNGVLT